MKSGEDSEKPAQERKQSEPAADVRLTFSKVRCCKRMNPLTLLAQSSPEAQRTQADVTVGPVGKAHAAVGAADLVAHAVAALTWHTAAGRKKGKKMKKKIQEIVR